MISQSPQAAALADSGHLTLSPAAGGNRFWQIAVLLFALLSFLEVSRVLDVVHVHVISVGVALLAIALALSRRALVFWKCGAGRVLPFFIAWILLAYFASQHSELGTQYVSNSVQGCLFFLAGTALLTSVTDFQKFFRLTALAGLILCALGLVWSSVMNGRFALRAGPYSDPNSYAMALLALAPIVWVSFPTKPIWLKIAAAIASTIPVLLAFRTVSRGGFVAMLAMLIVLFFLSSVRVKVAMVSAAVLLIIGFLAFLPDSLRTRLATAARVSSPTESGAPQTADSMSLDSRQTMLSTSINVSLAYPLLGVGPGNFGPLIQEYGKMQNQNWINLNTHNSYTQISSETGFPGLILFLSLIAFSLKSLLGVLRRTRPRGDSPNPEIHRLSAALLVSLAGTCTCLFFLSEGYSLMNFFWFGLANGLRLLLPEDPEEEDEFVEVEAEPVR